MYLEHYGLSEPPFSITPDPRFVFLSERHRDALAHLTYGVGQGGGGGFVQLTGEVGTGKTTLCRLLLEQLPANARVALVLNPKLTPVELLETICEELRIDLDGGPGGDRRGSVKRLVDALNAYLLDAYAQGLRVVLIVDEAQNLSLDALEQVRLLTNLETATQKLLQIILLGQPELRDMLARADMRQLAQRITARYHLTPLTSAETGDYLRHRLAVAGMARTVFDAAAIARIHTHTGGMPRLVNVLAERSLLAGYVHDRATLDEAMVELAAQEVLSTTPPATRARGPGTRRRLTAARVAIATAAVLGLGLGLAWWLQPAAQVATADAAPATPQSAPSITRTSAGPVAGAAARPLAAWQALLRLWQRPADEAAARVASRCPAQLPNNLYCMRGVTTLDVLATGGRPALLHLREGDHEAWAVLLARQPSTLRLVLADRTIDVTDDWLTSRWSGEYAMFWSTAELLVAPMPAGGRSPGVDWLHARLGLTGRVVFDEATRTALEHFQRERGLLVDGVPGPATRLALIAGTAPQLQPQRN